MIKYRSDIDGLRAIAVLSVVLFHLDIGIFSGGFVGVDVFFVISGYLITKILIKDAQENNSFSLRNFYERRAKRILPAYFVVAFVTSLASFYIMMPYDFFEYGKSLLGSVLFISNFVFLKETDYFAGDSAIKPLLHTWSLSVEEQFYIFFPIFFILLFRFFKKNITIFLFLFCTFSFLLACFLVYKFPDATFFLLPTRAWEFLIGACLATTHISNMKWEKWSAHFSILGLLLIAFPVLFFDEGIIFPGFNALYPCAGTALIIYFGYTSKGYNKIAKAISWKPLNLIGLMSYSLYLWHWPIIALFTYYYGDLSTSQKVSIFLGSLFVSYFSLKFIEKPFRSKESPSPKFIFFGSLSGVLLFSVIGLTIVGNNGFEERFVANDIEYEPLDVRRKNARESYRYGECFFGREHSIIEYDREKCLKFDDKKINYLLFGDSHAAHLWPGLQSSLTNYNFLQLNYGGCRATVGVNTAGTEGCEIINNILFNDVISDDRLDGVIIAGRWSSNDVDGLKRTLAFLKHRDIKVLIVGPVMEYTRNLPEILLYSKRMELDANLYQKSKIYLIDEEIRGIAIDFDVEYFSFIENLCPLTKCKVLIDSRIPVQWDYGHLSVEGSKFLASLIFTKTSL